MPGYFYGWYFKCQSNTQTLAIIPAVHGTGKNRTCSIQFITDDNVWTVDYPGHMFRRRGKNIYIGKNRFGKKGISLAIHTPRLTVRGELSFGALSPLKYHIMGPFALLPFMECRHSVWSMQHLVLGKVHINGQEYAFRNGRGYWEGDCGRSFPKEYIWTQCSFREGSLMLSIADIPVAGFHFTGIIGAVMWQGHEYRFATYLGAKIVSPENGRIKIVQGDMELEFSLIEKRGKALRAPTKGNMVRTIHESVAGRVFYRFRKGGRTIFSFETDRASFECEQLP